MCFRRLADPLSALGPLEAQRHTAKCQGSVGCRQAVWSAETCRGCDLQSQCDLLAAFRPGTPLQLGVGGTLTSEFQTRQGVSGDRLLFFNKREVWSQASVPDIQPEICVREPTEGLWVSPQSTREPTRVTTPECHRHVAH